MAIDWQCRCAFIHIVFISVSTINQGLGSKSIHPHDKEVQNSLDFAVESFNTFSKDDHLFKVTRVVSARVEDLGGLLYILDAKLGRTQCRKGADENLTSCSSTEVAGLAKKFLCHFEVLSTFWRDEKYILQSNCKPLSRQE
ncbi:cystatin-like [Scyliorhinus torazame]|uniref:cystatin-like n=1 Tax=Scyliorhinus torazame TaxID=75743 RepID=UPI003B5AE9E8